MPEMTTVVDTSVSATPARVGFPLNHAGITATNSGTTAVYYRYDPDALTSTLAGATDAAMKALGGSRIDAGESVFFPGTVPYIDVVCVTGVTGTLQYDAGVENFSLAQTSLLKATAARTSVLYNGGGTANALQEPTTTSAIPANAAVISVGTNNVLELCLFNATAAETVTVSLAEYSAASPTIATLIRQVSVPTGSDLARTVDRACVGLTTGTEIYAKAPVRVTVTPGRYVVLSVLENITGAAYVRYQLLGSV